MSVSATEPILQTYTASQPCKKRNALKIIIIVFLVLFVFSVGTKIALGKYIFHKTADIFEESFLSALGNQLEGQFSEKSTNVTSLEEFNSLIEKAREHQRENYDRVKDGQPVVFYEFTDICVKNGVTKEVNTYNMNEFCYEEGGDYDCGNCTRLGRKVTEVTNLSDSIVALYAESILLLLAENTNEVAIKLNEEGEGSLDVVGATLGVLQVVSRVTVTWSGIIPMINDGTGIQDEHVPYINWDDDSPEKLSKLVEFADKIPEVTEEQINALNFILKKRKKLQMMSFSRFHILVFAMD